MERVRPVLESTLQRVAAGDSAAVQECLDRYGGLVWSLARRFCYNNQADAEDAVQEIFLDLWKSAGRFDGSVASEATFVAMIARRRLIDRRRRAARRPEMESAAAIDDVRQPDSSAESGVEVVEDAARASRALTLLRPEQQRVLRMSIYLGLSHEKIAEATGMPLGTVKTHVRRGLIRLRELMQPGGAGGESMGDGSGVAS